MEKEVINMRKGGKIGKSGRFEPPVKEKNPAHTCMGPDCNKYLGHRGFCSTKCHNSHYD